MSTAIRLAPSGPPVMNDSGAPYAPGAGAPIRLVELTMVSTSGNALRTLPATLNPNFSQPVEPDTVLVLSAPNPGLRYRATAVCDVENPSTNVSYSAQMVWDVSNDGVLWTVAASNTHDIGPNSVRQMRLDMPLQTGADLGVESGQIALYARCRIGSTTGGSVLLLSGDETPGISRSVGAVDLQLLETF